MFQEGQDYRYSPPFPPSIPTSSSPSSLFPTSHSDFCLLPPLYLVSAAGLGLPCSMISLLITQNLLGLFTSSWDLCCITWVGWSGTKSSIRPSHSFCHKGRDKVLPHHGNESPCTCYTLEMIKRVAGPRIQYAVVLWNNADDFAHRFFLLRRTTSFITRCRSSNYIWIQRHVLKVYLHFARSETWMSSVETPSNTCLLDLFISTALCEGSKLLTLIVCL